MSGALLILEGEVNVWLLLVLVLLLDGWRSGEGGERSGCGWPVRVGVVTVVLRRGACDVYLLV